MTRKLPHVGLGLPDMAERSMPHIPGLTWQDPAEEAARRAALFESIASFVEAAVDGTMAMREPIRVVAEVGEPIPEIESS